MRKFAVVIFILVMAASTFAVGQDSKVSVFGGWQFFSIDTKNLDGRQNTAEGWDADVAFKMVKCVSLVGDISGSYKSVTASSSGVSGTVNAHAYNFLFGPRFSAKAGKLTPFAEVLVGFNHPSLSLSGSSLSTSSNGLAMAVGGGLDYNASKGLALRLAKFDYLLNRVDFSSSSLNVSTGSQNLNNFRIAAGLVFKF